MRDAETDDDSETWWSHFLAHSCLLPGMISEAWPSVYASSGAQPHQCRLYYIQFCVRADFTAICLFGHVVSQRETRPEASITHERGNRADQSVLSIRQPGLSRPADCVPRIREAQMTPGDFCCVAAVYLKSWRTSSSHSNENQTTMFGTEVIRFQLWSDQ